MHKLTTTDRKSLIRLASELPKGSDERRAILAGLKSATGNKIASAYMLFLKDVEKIEAAMHSARANLSRFPKDQRDFARDMERHLDLVAKALKEIDRSI